MKKVISNIFLISVLVFIFYMSAQNSISSNNYNVKIVNQIRTKAGFDLYNHYGKNIVDILIRKIGHFLEFALLSIAAYLVFIRSKIRCVYILSIVSCISYAVIDELHQLYVSGRQSSIIDVFIDSAGVVIVLSIISLIKNIKYELLNRDDNSTSS